MARTPVSSASRTGSAVHGVDGATHEGLAAHLQATGPRRSSGLAVGVDDTAQQAIADG